MTAYPEPKDRVLYQYNLTSEQWWQLFGAGVCPICERPYKHHLPQRRACIDHDHATHQVRGMLCGYCNYELGCLHENVGWLERAASYLRTPTSEALLVSGVWSEIPVSSDAPPVRENDK